jgi:hypothetical protein
MSRSRPDGRPSTSTKRKVETVIATRMTAARRGETGVVKAGSAAVGAWSGIEGCAEMLLLAGALLAAALAGASVRTDVDIDDLLFITVAGCPRTDERKIETILAQPQSCSCETIGK